MHCVRRFRERAEELAWRSLRRGRQADPRRPRRGRAPHRYVPHRGRGGGPDRRRGAPARREPARRGLSRHVQARPRRAGASSSRRSPIRSTWSPTRSPPRRAAGCPFVLRPHDLARSARSSSARSSPRPGPAGGRVLDPAVRSGLRRAARHRSAARSSSASPAAPPPAGPSRPRAGKKKVVLELGGNDAVIVERDADLDDALPRLVQGAFHQTGSVQRILVHDELYGASARPSSPPRSALPVGDPLDEATVIGPMMSEADAAQLEAWIAEARPRRRHRRVRRPARDGVMFPATLARGRAARRGARRRRGLRAHRRARPLHGLRGRARRGQRHRLRPAGRRLHARPLPGAARLGRARGGRGHHQRGPVWRIDNMPYGGVKDSGRGREGARWAIEDMTEIRLLVVRTLAAR